MKKRLWLTMSLLLVTVLIISGCASKAIKPLTDDEKDTMIEIALNHPEVSKWLETASVNSTEVGWVTIAWGDSQAVGWYRMDYEDIADGSPPSDITYITDKVTIHPQIYIRVGEPVRMFISVAFDRETKKVVHVELLPGR